MTVRIAMWSGPRNISTAMMRAWENRSDCAVIDEPFYACYLVETGADHPCRGDILNVQPTSRNRVIATLTAEGPAPIYYHKHMTHHMPRGCDLAWAAGMRHAFLIRDPAAVIASYLKKMPNVTSDDIGIVRQWELFEAIADLTGTPPPVIDGADVLEDPPGVLKALCSALDVPWRGDEMLQWRAGPRDSDGIWAEHWYQSVWASTGFAAPALTKPTLSATALDLAESMRPYYVAMASRRLR